MFKCLLCFGSIKCFNLFPSREQTTEEWLQCWLPSFADYCTVRFSWCNKKIFAFGNHLLLKLNSWSKQTHTLFEIGFLETAMALCTFKLLLYRFAESFGHVIITLTLQ